ncbi:restriction endonuclease subunit S [Bradyrhizobium japonicum]|uniref:restriction endonuclease subunit S n=1 Tax=Bradyrhizobium japonicum TaxID=375 RepID=UPI001BAC42F9|nr:restriction endonuclease subunit S [Bradyrhizobium japonicum]MBR0993991.1 restriction endonuclease subunit S [Bradyrhizobium japonicum]
MSAERLLAHYDRIADAPDAIVQLRRLILDLAVRGKLVPQEPNDEPASELLKRIANERARLIKVGEIRDKPSLERVANADAAYPIPLAWEWVRFANIADFSAGRTPLRNDTSFWNTGDYAWVSIGDMEDGQVLTSTRETVSEKAREKVFGSEPEPPGTILMSFKLTIGKIARLGLPAFHNEAIISIRPHLAELDAYLFKILPKFAKQGDTKGAIKGATLNRDSISNILLPLPPLGEQDRIVSKIDELMGLCDQLETARGRREGIRDRLAGASLLRLNAPDSDNFEFDARFALDALPALTTRPDQIRQLRQTILNLAARGKLVRQDSNDEPASELLKRIAGERAELVKKKEIRREDPLDPVQSAEVPFDVPATWVWSRIGDAVLFTQYGTSQQARPSADGVPVLTMGNVQDGLVVWSNEKRIPQSSEDLPALYLRKFDLLYNRTNSAELVGKTGIYLGDDGVRTFASYLIRLRPSLLSSNPRYLNIAMNAPEFRQTQIVPLIKKQTGQANVNGTALKNMLIPLPPLAEQERIVTMVDSLMAICDRLEANLTAAAIIRRRLLDALLAEAVAPNDDRELEAAE